MTANIALIFIAGVIAVAAVAGAGFYLVGPNGGGGVATSTIRSSTTSITPGGLNATEAILPDWVSSQNGAANLFSRINGHSIAYNCALAAGSTLPTGLVLTPNCGITGTTTLSPGTTKEISPPFTVVLSGTTQPAESANFTFSIVIVSSGPTLIPVQGICTVGVQCHSQIADAEGGTPEYYYVNDLFRNGTTPFGTSIGTDGFITGTADQTGLFVFGICVIDSVAAETCGHTSVLVVNETNTTTSTTTINETTTANYTTTIGYNTTTTTACSSPYVQYPDGSCSCPSGSYMQPDASCGSSCPSGWSPNSDNICVYQETTTIPANVTITSLTCSGGEVTASGTADSEVPSGAVLSILPNPVDSDYTPSISCTVWGPNNSGFYYLACLQGSGPETTSWSVSIGGVDESTLIDGQMQLEAYIFENGSAAAGTSATVTCS